MGEIKKARLMLAGGQQHLLDKLNMATGAEWDSSFLQAPLRKKSITEIELAGNLEGKPEVFWSQANMGFIPVNYFVFISF